MFLKKIKLSIFLFLSLFPNIIGRKFRKEISNIQNSLNQQKKINELQKKYNLTLQRVKQKVKNNQKIRVGFLITENQKWGCQSLYEELEESKFFEPIVLITKFKPNSRFSETTTLNMLNESIKFFKEKNLKFEITYDLEKEEYISLKKFKIDIIFYQQPWGRNELQYIFNTSSFALSCYIPYCFHMLNAENNYFQHFHALLWKYFTESDIYTKYYEKIYNAKNCITTGHAKLDNYKKIKNFTKNIAIKTVIYAPHHSFTRGTHRFATFDKNGKFILELAKKHKNIHWIFKPHPMFELAVVTDKIMSQSEFDDYMKEWKNLPNVTIYTQGDYYPLFKESDALITDCISFLAEYLPSKNPVLLLKSSEQNHQFSKFGSLITKYYYKINKNSELEKIFNRVILKGDDYLKEKRIGCIKHLNLEEKRTTAEKIINQLKMEFDINE